MSTSFFVPGLAAPKGSARGFVVNGRAVVTHDNKRTKSFEHAVRMSAVAAGLEPRQEGWLQVYLRFVLPRPKAHLRRDGTVKPSAPERPTVKPDLDKLARTVLDALTGVAYRDDAQVAAISATKLYGAAPGVHVTVADAEGELP